MEIFLIILYYQQLTGQSLMMKPFAKIIRPKWLVLEQEPPAIHASPATGIPSPSHDTITKSFLSGSMFIIVGQVLCTGKERTEVVQE